MLTCSVTRVTLGFLDFRQNLYSRDNVLSVDYLLPFPLLFQRHCVEYPYFLFDFCIICYIVSLLKTYFDKKK